MNGINIDDGIMRNCPLCEHSKSSDLYRQPVYTRELIYCPSKVVRCNACHFIFLNPIMKNDDYNIFYNLNLQYNFVKNIINKNNVIKDNLRRIEIVKKNLPYTKTILDVGAGTGDFVKLAQEYYEILGIEIGNQRANLAINDGANVITKDLYDYNDRHDAITLFHVLEHIPNPHQFVEKLFNTLNENGLLFIEVPNHNDILLYKNSFRNFYYQVAHCSYFTPNSLLSLMQNYFDIVKVLPTQRYSLDNHLHWIFKNSPGKININTTVLDIYDCLIKQTKYYDTIFMIFRKSK